ncbi:MAG: hypothetical protein ABI612_10435 [Betaproteobacteria bacterium]
MDLYTLENAELAHQTTNLRTGRRCYVIRDAPAKRTAVFVLLSVIALALVHHSAAQAQEPPPEARPPAPTTGGANAITLAAAQKGVLNCASRINQVSLFLGFGPQAGAVLMVPPSEPDQRLIALAMEVTTEGNSGYVSAAFAPNQANGCGAAYDAVMYWPQTCEAVASRQFATMKRVTKMKKDIAVLDGGAATKVFLMPAGNGCVSIKKEVVL